MGLERQFCCKLKKNLCNISSSTYSNESIWTFFENKTLSLLEMFAAHWHHKTCDNKLKSDTVMLKSRKPRRLGNTCIFPKIIMTNCKIEHSTSLSFNQISLYWDLGLTDKLHTDPQALSLQSVYHFSVFFNFVFFTFSYGLISFFLPCSACGRGFYKSSSQDLQCSRCPAHSFNDREGSWRCDCEDGYYRALSDPPSVACTSKSSMPLLGKHSTDHLPIFEFKQSHMQDKKNTRKK